MFSIVNSCAINRFYMRKTCSISVHIHTVINTTVTEVFKEIVRNVSKWTYTFHFVVAKSIGKISVKIILSAGYVMWQCTQSCYC